MRKLLILPVFLLFAACPEKMIPDGGGTIKNFQMTETESEYRFTWDAVDLSEYKAAVSFTIYTDTVCLRIRRNRLSFLFSTLP